MRKGAFFFQELSFAATLALLGNAARLPIIQTLRGDRQKYHIPPAEGHPFYWFLKDAQSFFAGYADYRDRLVDLLHELDSGRAPSKIGALFQRARFCLVRLLPMGRAYKARRRQSRHRHHPCNLFRARGGARAE